MAKKKKNTQKSKKLWQLIFRKFGKYFLIAFLVLGQVLTAYSVVEKNYDAIYSYTQSLMSGQGAKTELKEIIINPADTNGQRYLLVQLSLEVVDKDGLELVKENKSKIRNNLIKYLSAKTVPELQGIRGKKDLRVELIQLINETIGSRSVRNLYYSKYVMQ